MREITITIRPSLSDIDDPSRLVNVLEDVRQRIESNLDLCVEKVAEKTLEFAKENAEMGYDNVPHTGNRGVVWEPRDSITERLYALSPYHYPSETGLDAGKRKLIGSLERDGDDNIFERTGLEVKIGTGFRHAYLLEKGGIRPAVPNLGFHVSGKPREWLMKAIREGRISRDEVNRIWDIVSRPQFMPPRPFLFPAMWEMEDNELHTLVCVKELLYQLQYDLETDRVQARGDLTDVIE